MRVELIERLRSREQDVLRLAAHGLDNEAIAEQLGIARRTVVVYWQGIYQVLGVAKQKGKKRHAIAWWRGLEGDH
jgi:DNA-binding NarL/FixJ family response regulator